MPRPRRCRGTTAWQARWLSAPRRAFDARTWVMSSGSSPRTTWRGPVSRASARRRRARKRASRLVRERNVKDGMRAPLPQMNPLTLVWGVEGGGCCCSPPRGMRGRSPGPRDQPVEEACLLIADLRGPAALANHGVRQQDFHCGHVVHPTGTTRGEWLDWYVEFPLLTPYHRRPSASLAVTRRSAPQGSSCEAFRKGRISP